GREAPSPPFNRQSAQQYEAAAVEHFLEYSLQAFAESWHRTVSPVQRLEVRFRFGQRPARVGDLCQFVGRQRLDPVATACHLLAVPGRGTANLGGQFRRVSLYVCAPRVASPCRALSSARRRLPGGSAALLYVRLQCERQLSKQLRPGSGQICRFARV